MQTIFTLRRRAVTCGASPIICIVLLFVVAFILVFDVRFLFAGDAGLIESSTIESAPRLNKITLLVGTALASYDPWSGSNTCSTQFQVSGYLALLGPSWAVDVAA